MHETLAAVLEGRSLADAVLFALPLFITPIMSLRQRRRFGQDAHLRRPVLYRRFLVQQWLIVLGIAIVWLGNGRPLSGLGLDIPLSWQGRAGLLVVAGVTVVVFVYQYVSLRRMNEAGRARLLARLLPVQVAPHTRREVLLFVPVAVTAGISEELLYRGYLIWYLAPVRGVLVAVVLSTLLFGLAHLYQGWRGVLGSTALGLIFGSLYAVSGSLWWVMGLHAVNDLQFCLVGLFLASWNRENRGTASTGS